LTGEEHNNRNANDTGLLELIANGDETAFKSLYNRFNAQVYNTALVYIQNQFEAEEITQDVFLEIHKSAKGFDGKSSLSTWIYRITINKSIDRLRYNSRKKRFAKFINLFSQDENEFINDVPFFDHPGVLNENKEKADILFKALNKLTEQQKTAFILTYIEGLTGKEAAETMNISSKAVESLIQRAKVNLRKELEKFYPERRK